MITTNKDKRLIHHNKLKEKFGDHALRMIRDFNIKPWHDYGPGRHGGKWYLVEKIQAVIDNVDKCNDIEGRMPQRRMPNKIQTERQKNSIKSFFK